MSIAIRETIIDVWCQTQQVDWCARLSFLSNVQLRWPRCFIFNSTCLYTMSCLLSAAALLLCFVLHLVSRRLSYVHCILHVLSRQLKQQQPDPSTNKLGWWCSRAEYWQWQLIRTARRFIAANETSKYNNYIAPSNSREKKSFPIWMGAPSLITAPYPSTTFFHIQMDFALFF
jgi:hypothetical protein